MTMRALLCRQNCEWDDLEITDIAPPPMVAMGVRIEVHYASVSFAMSLQVAGRYQRTYPLPFTPGTEVAGVVMEVAEGVTQVKAGDRVLAIVDWGGLAAQVVTPAYTVYPVPEGLPLNPGIHLPNAYGTAYGALDWRGHLMPGESLLVLGAAGGVGSAAVELGRVLGAQVIAAASSEEKRRFALAHGAHFAVGYEQMREAVKEITDGQGVDLVYDPVGGAAFDGALRCVGTFGRIVTLGFASGTAPRIPANLLLVKNIAVLGHNMGLYYGWGPQDQRALYEERMRGMMDDLFTWTVEGKLHPHVSHCLPLSQFREAMRVIREREAQGKVIIDPRAA
jgi:NADPH2:quinone reductase